MMRLAQGFRYFLYYAPLSPPPSLPLSVAFSLPLISLHLSLESLLLLPSLTHALSSVGAKQVLRLGRHVVTSFYTQGVRSVVGSETPFLPLPPEIPTAISTLHVYQRRASYTIPRMSRGLKMPILLPRSLARKEDPCPRLLPSPLSSRFLAASSLDAICAPDGPPRTWLRPQARPRRARPRPSPAMKRPASRRSRPRQRPPTTQTGCIRPLCRVRSPLGRPACQPRPR